MRRGFTGRKGCGINHKELDPEKRKDPQQLAESGFTLD
jgi:hypothetical protein